MHRASSFPAPAERRRTRARLEASLAGLCELELRRQRQEGLVSRALTLGAPVSPQYMSHMAGFCYWGQENLTLMRQLTALQNSPWGLMQALEKQVGELRMDPTNGSYEPACGDAADSRPSSGFYESSEGHSPKESCEPTDPGCSWAFSSEHSPSLGDPLRLSDTQDPRPLLARSFSAPHPPVQGIAEEAWAKESWRWESQSGRSRTPSSSPVEEQEVSEEEYQRALKVEGYILGLIKQHTLPPRPCQPRTILNPDLLHGPHRKTPSHTLEPSSPDLSATPESRAWAGGLLQGEAPASEEDCYLALPYPSPRPLSLALPPLHLSCGGGGTLNLCHGPRSPGTSPSPQPLPPHTEDLVCAQYIPGQGCHAPLHSPSCYSPDQLRSDLLSASPDRPHPPAKRRGSKTSRPSDRQASRKGGNKSSRSQSEHSLLGQPGLPERSYNTAERPQGRRGPAERPTRGISGAGRRCLSNLELNQDQGVTGTMAGPGRKPARAYAAAGSGSPTDPHQHGQTTQRQAWNLSERAPICRGEGVHARTAPGESESSTSEGSSFPASSSLSSDSDESAGLVWPQQIPPCPAPSTSSSLPYPQAAADAPSSSSQPKAFVKIKASHALKKKILRFRSGSLKVMTTV